MEVMKSPAEADGPAQDAHSLVLTAAWLAFPPLAQGHAGPAVLAEAGEVSWAVERWLGTLGAPHEPVEAGEAGTYSRVPTPPTCPRSPYTRFCLNDYERRGARCTQITDELQDGARLHGSLSAHPTEGQQIPGKDGSRRERTPAAASTPHICTPGICWGPKAGDHGVPAERSLIKVQKHSRLLSPSWYQHLGLKPGSLGSPHGDTGGTPTRHTGGRDPGPGAPAGPVLRTGPPRALSPSTRAAPRDAILMAPEG